MPIIYIINAIIKEHIWAIHYNYNHIIRKQTYTLGHNYSVILKSIYIFVHIIQVQNQ